DCLTHTAAGIRCSRCSGIRRSWFAPRWAQRGRSAVTFLILCALIILYLIMRSGLARGGRPVGQPQFEPPISRSTDLAPR
ncbi:MAG: hypothetical protein EB039_10395, partial [Proteobacteria bacterium]|nr:hypothetical protein [Pseudomonadota bacterium]